MKRTLQVHGKSQYDADIDPTYRPSACGPVTAYVLLHYHKVDMSHLDVNKLYQLLGGTKIGLSKRRLIQRLRHLLGEAWSIQEIDIQNVKAQIDAGFPVAAKFDKWFRFRWFGTYTYHYHWVPVVGYEEVDGDFLLIVHDNGGRLRDSQLRRISYQSNRAIISFVKVAPHHLERKNL